MTNTDFKAQQISHKHFFRHQKNSNTRATTMVLCFVLCDPIIVVSAKNIVDNPISSKWKQQESVFHVSQEIRQLRSTEEQPIWRRSISIHKIIDVLDKITINCVHG